jgi:hypothetical protein
MKKVYTSNNQNKNTLNFWSRKVMVVLFSACTLMSTACQKEEEEVRPETEASKIEQAAKDLTGIKPVTILIKSEGKDDKPSN